jgi:hypothetical protein
MPKQITQAEIHALLGHHEAAFDATLAIRRRMDEEGATVEPGRYALKSAGAADPISDYGKDQSIHEIERWGLEIYEAEESHA